MSSITTLLALATVWCGATVSANVVSLDLNRGNLNSRSYIPSRHLSKRATVTESLLNNATAGGYFATVSVGTPGQSMPLILDTGSSDAWMIASNASMCTSARLQAELGGGCDGSFDITKSSTAKVVNASGFSIQYLDGSTATGDYITDAFSIGGSTVSALQMGYATELQTGIGILGIGFDANEAATTTYPNLIDQLFNQSFISRKAYSLYLNDPDASTGSILFGGADTDKFIGTLDYLPMLQTAASVDAVSQSDLTYTTFAVTMTGLTTGYGNGTNASVSGLSSDSALPAILDSGTTLTYLPDAYAYPLFDQLGAYTDDQSTGVTFVSCDIASSNPDMVVYYTFGPSSANSTTTVTIAVPISELLLSITMEDLGVQVDTPFSSACVLGIQAEGDSTSTGSGSGSGGSGPSNARFGRVGPSRLVAADDYRVLASDASVTTSYALLGDTFLRSAYVLYDLDGKSIGMAKANLNSTGGTDASVTELPGPGTTALPTLVGVASQQTTATATATGGGGGSSTGGTGTASSSSSTATSTQENVGAVGAPPQVGEMVAVVFATMLLTLAGGSVFML